MIDRWDGILLTREQLEVWAGTHLSESDLERLEEAIPNSSIPEAIAAIVDNLADE